MNNDRNSRRVSINHFASILLSLLAGCGAWSAPVYAADAVRVADGPFITAGGLYIAQDKGYFNKVGVAVSIKPFMDGSFALPSIIAGEIDITFLPAAASLFNSISKGAPVVVFADRGNNRSGNAYSAFVVSQAMYNQGIRSLSDLGKLKGRKIALSALGSINQYTMSLALLKVGLDPTRDVQWIVNVPQPDIIKMLGQQQADASDLAYNVAAMGQMNSLARIVGTGDEVAPGGQIATYAVRKSYLAEHRDVLIRWTMAYLQGVREFNAAAADPDRYPEIVDILARNTRTKPEVVKDIAPNWSYISEEGVPNIDSIMEMQDFWSGPYFQMVEKKVTREQLFDLSIVKDAKARFDRERTFGR
jgi:NitT/TauT family transport system substrate-binding protein